MPSLQRNIALVAVGFASLSALAFGTHLSVTANNLAGLRQLNIRMNGPITIHTNETLLVSAEGDYGTYNAPLRAFWSIVAGRDKGEFLGDCNDAKTCEFFAAQSSGPVTIRAEANGFHDETTFYITGPSEVEPPAPVEHGFTDEVPAWANIPVVELHEQGIVGGYQDGSFGAGDLLTRGQLYTLFYRTLNAENIIASNAPCDPFSDVAEDHYAYTATCTFRAMGWGESLQTLQPDEPVSRGETASLLNQVIGPQLLSSASTNLGLIAQGGQIYSDIPTNHPFFTDTAVLHTFGVMTGDPDGRFGPSRTLNRAEAATIFWRVLDTL